MNYIWSLSFLTILFSSVLGQLDEGAYVQCKALDCSLCLYPKIAEFCPKYCSNGCGTSRRNFESKLHHVDDDDLLKREDFDTSASLDVDSFKIDSRSHDSPEEDIKDKAAKSVENLELIGSDVTKTEKNFNSGIRKNKEPKSTKPIQRKYEKEHSSRKMTSRDAEVALLTCCLDTIPSCASKGVCSYNLTIDMMSRGFSDGCSAPEFMTNVYRCQTEGGHSNLGCCSSLPLKCQVFCSPSIPSVITSDLYTCLAYFNTIQKCNLRGQTKAPEEPDIALIDPQQIWNLIFDQGSYWSKLTNPNPQSQVGFPTQQGYVVGTPQLAQPQPQFPVQANQPINEQEESNDTAEVATPPPGEILDGILFGLSPLLSANGINPRISPVQNVAHRPVVSDFPGFQNPSLFAGPGILPSVPQYQSYYPSQSAQNSAGSIFEQLLGAVSKRRRSPVNDYAYAPNPYYLPQQQYYYNQADQVRNTGVGSFLQPVFSSLLGKKKR